MGAKRGKMWAGGEVFRELGERNGESLERMMEETKMRRRRQGAAEDRATLLSLLAGSPFRFFQNGRTVWQRFHHLL